VQWSRRNLVFTTNELVQEKENHPSCQQTFMENTESSGEEVKQLSKKDKLLSVTDGESLDQSQPLEGGKWHPKHIRNDLPIKSEGDHDSKNPIK